MAAALGLGSAQEEGSLGAAPPAGLQAQSVPEHRALRGALGAPGGKGELAHGHTQSCAARDATGANGPIR